MKTKAFTLFATLTLSFLYTLNAQEFSFEIYFEDAAGNRDTITLGFDPSGRDGIDVQFGEVNIIDVPLKSTLDVRITDEWDNRFIHNTPGTYHTKTQIIQKQECGVDFSINSIDIHTKNWPVTASWDSSLFTDPCLEAKNTFSANPLQYGHFRNDGGQVITYFYNTNPPIYYTPRLVVPVFVTAVNNCPSNYGGNDPKPLVFNENQRQEREMDFAANLSNYHSVKLLFDNLEDGGNTQNLKSEIDAAWPKDMWDLRAKLLGLSPHLSEEVLMATADKTDVLPESVLFEILSANPDELKKETLIEYLENKENPLPEYMISILRQLAGGITYKTVLMQDMAKYEAEKVNAVNDLIRSCLNDDETDMNYLRTWYNNLNSLNADYGIVDTYLTEKNFDAAASMLEVIPSTRNLFGDELNEFLEYRNLVQWQIQKHQQVSDITNIDSTDFDMLLAIAQNGSIRASSQAMAILEYGTGYHFNNCLYESIPGSNKNISVENPGKDIGLSISANPNPANSWVAFGYKLPLYVNSGEISVTDMQGRLLASYRVTGNAGQKVWDIRNIQKGVYLYTLKAGNRSKQGKLVIQ